MGYERTSAFTENTMFQPVFWRARSSFFYPSHIQRSVQMCTIYSNERYRLNLLATHKSRDSFEHFLSFCVQIFSCFFFSVDRLERVTRTSHFAITQLTLAVILLPRLMIVCALTSRRVNFNLTIYTRLCLSIPSPDRISEINLAERQLLLN